MRDFFATNPRACRSLYKSIGGDRHDLLDANVRDAAGTAS